MMKKESHAYKMGFDCGINESNTTNSHFSIFSDETSTRDWEHGLKDGREAKKKRDNSINTKLQNLEIKRKELQKKINILHEDREKELLPIYKKNFIGKCFKYRNSYGRDSEKWWLYVRVKDITSVNFCNAEEPIAEIISIQKCSNGAINIEI